MFGGDVMKIYGIKEFEGYNSLNVKINKEIVGVGIIGKKIVSVNKISFVICIIMVLFFVFSFDMIRIFAIYI